MCGITFCAHLANIRHDFTRSAAAQLGAVKAVELSFRLVFVAAAFRHRRAHTVLAEVSRPIVTEGSHGSRRHLRTGHGCTRSFMAT